MSILELAILEMIKEFEKYPVLQRAWASMSDEEQMMAMKDFADSVGETIASE